MKKLLLLAAVMLGAIAPAALAFAGPSVAIAQTDASKEAVCKGVIITGGTCDEGTGEEGLNAVIATVINIFSILVGVAAVIMVIVGGFKYVTSSGDSNTVSSAKNTILFALVGLVVVAMAQVIVQFVINEATQ